MIGRLRLISGFVLFIFVLGHFSNHALGLVSISLMNDATAYIIAPWRTLPGTILILASLSVHALLAVWALYDRRTLRMKSWELFQLTSGFLIPILLAAHVMSTRGAYEAFGLQEGYGYQLYVQWIAAPYRSAMIFAGLILVWVHSCIGWHYWLRYKRWYNQALPLISALAVLIPTLAIAGIVSAGFKVLRLAEEESWVTYTLKKIDKIGEDYVRFILDNEFIIIMSVVGVVIAILSIHGLKWIWRQKHSGINLTYRGMELDERVQLKVTPGHTVLAHLQENRIPHASVCGGRGRCSTCRIRIDESTGALPPLSVEETKILQRIGAEENVRLACQLKLENNIAVSALLRPSVGSREALNQYRHKSGEEQDVAILFADIRAFTKLSESQLPYDTAFLLNRFFAAMGKAIEESGGHLDKFIGDGVMAIFGIDKPLKVGCAEALQAAKAMSIELEKLNKSLIEDTAQPLKIGIGIDSGQAIIGNMGYNQAMGLTAIGDVVNTASRLESLTKELGSQLVVSQKTVEASGMNLANTLPQKVSVRGRVDQIKVYSIKNPIEALPSFELS